ncbi:MAG TPA: SDR family oxidoreductase [Acidimicrobiia bacterium]|nr:SDR family oxidoreductase [Acidimicrobiia bacterium]
MRRVVVTGANRGLGLEMTRQLLAAGHEVVAAAREPKLADELQKIVSGAGERAAVVRLDVADPDSVAAAALHVGERLEAVDLLVNNAGVWSAPGHPERVSAGALADLRAEPVLDVLRVNAVGPILVTQALAPLLAAARSSVVVNLSSGLGSIAGATGRGNVGYGMSKAALNMLTRHLAAELARQGTVVVAMSPGWVATDMGGPQATLRPDESVRGLLNVVDALTPAQSGAFLDHTGATLPW